MTNFWPSEIDLSDTRSPHQILSEAEKDWEAKSNGLLTLVLQMARSQSGNAMIIVHAKHVQSKRTGSLFSVVHRPNNPYPVTIFPNDDDVPNILRKTYHDPGFGALLSQVTSDLHRNTGKTVENEWVADTPLEFREKLERVFNLGFVKSVVLNLLASDKPTADNTDAESEDAG